MKPQKTTGRREGPALGHHARKKREGQSPESNNPSANLTWGNVAARWDGQIQLVVLLHHADRSALEQAFRQQKQRASTAVDGVTVEISEQGPWTLTSRRSARAFTLTLPAATATYSSSPIQSFP